MTSHARPGAARVGRIARATLAVAMTLMTPLPTMAAPDPTSTRVGAVDVAADGRGRAAVDWPREVPLEFETWVASANWSRMDQQWALRDRKNVTPDAGGVRGVTGHFDLGDNRVVRLDQRIAPSRVDYTFTAEDAVDDLTGLYWVATLPSARFAGGRVTIGEADAPLTLPRDRPAEHALGGGRASRVVVRSADGGDEVTLSFGTADAGLTEHDVRVQDARGFGVDGTQLLVRVADRAALARGDVVRFGVSVASRLAPRAGDVAHPGDVARVRVDPAKPLNRFDGLGGNFVYGIEADTTRVALEAMPRPAWARVGMELRDWEPTNDNGDPRLTNAAALAARDVPGSGLRRRFEMDRELFARSGGRLIASLWYPPEWLFDEPLPHRYREQAGTIPRERWDELAECVVSYLTHLRDRYGVEPALVSLNEPDLGVYVLQDGAAHRDWIKHLGAALGAAGLTKTKLLLGDVADLEKGLAMIQPTLDDAAARAFVGGVAYHPWAGQNAHWPAWAAVAERLNVPLLATEMGADAQAWHDGTFDAPLYALRLARRYVEQVRDARTAALLEWEWSGDFPMTRPGPDGKATLTPRGLLLRQLWSATPADARVIETTTAEARSAIATTMATVTTRAADTTDTNAANLTVAALAGTDGVALHLVNGDAERRVEVSGLPDGPVQVTSLDLRSGATSTGELAVARGACALTLPSGSLTTLRTR